jgi:hypothetical protein
MTASLDQIFHRSLTAHLPAAAFARLQESTVLVGGVGGGSNIAELLVRKGFGRIILADLDVYEPHNVRQRGSTASSWGRPKVEVMRERLLDINPHVQVTSVPEGVTADNVVGLVERSSFILDMIDFHGLAAKAQLYRVARELGRTVVTAPSLVNGALLYVFTPTGVTFETFFGYEDGLPPAELGLRLLRRLVPRYPAEAPAALYEAAARGERTLPLDGVGVDQAAVLAVSALENLALGRMDRVVTVPRFIHVDVSDPAYLGRIVEL